MAPMLMSERTWNSLPQDIQLIIEQLNKELSIVFYNNTMEVVKIAYGVASQGKRQIIKLSPADGDKLQKVLVSVTGEFVEKVNANGLPGTEVQRKATEVMDLWNSGKLK
jgi:TRAP-type C4-dicarboxylate transport system substrate-binding protein